MNLAKRKAAQQLGKVAGKFIPGLGWVILAWEISELLKPPPSAVPSLGQGWERHWLNEEACQTSGGSLGYRQISWSAHTHDACATVNASKGGIVLVQNPQPTAVLRRAIEYQNLNAVTMRGRQCYRHQGTAFRPLVQPLPSTVVHPNPDPYGLPDGPVYQPWFDPSLPPQMQPQAKTDPRYVPGRVGPHIPPNTDPRDIDPGPLVGPRIPRRRRGGGGPPRFRPSPRPRPRLPPGIDPMPGPPVRPFPQPIVDPPPAPRPAPLPNVTPPWPWPGPGPSPGVATPPATELPPGTEIVVAPSPGTAPRPRPRPLPRPRPGHPPPTFPAPPPPRDKERKVGMSALGYGWAMWLFNFTTEARDYIDAVYKALPCALRSKAHDTPAKKMRAVYDNWDDVNLEAMMTELFLNQVEDYVIGRASGAINKGFGSGDSWANYYRAFQTGNEVLPTLGKDVNRYLDQVAKSLSLPRVRCGRN